MNTQNTAAAPSAPVSTPAAGKENKGKGKAKPVKAEKLIINAAAGVEYRLEDLQRELNTLRSICAPIEIDKRLSDAGLVKRATTAGCAEVEFPASSMVTKLKQEGKITAYEAAQCAALYKLNEAIKGVLETSKRAAAEALLKSAGKRRR